MAEQTQSAHIKLIGDNTYSLSGVLIKNLKAVIAKLQELEVLTDKDWERLSKASEKRLVPLLLAILCYHHADTFVKFLEALCSLEREGVAELLECIKRLVDDNLLPRELLLASDDPFAERLRRVKEHVTLKCRQPSFIHGTMEVSTIHRDSKLFYSPTHDVSVEFPLNSLPPDVPEFQLCVGMCDLSKLILPDACILCTPVVWIGTCPPNIRFARDTVRVSMPHCAVIQCVEDVERLVVLNRPDPTKEEDVIDFSQDNVLEMDIDTGVDFSDGNSVTFTVGCFCLFAGVTDTRRRKRKHFGEFDHLLCSRVLAQDCQTPEAKKACETPGETFATRTGTRSRGHTWSHCRRLKFPVPRKQLSASPILLVAEELGLPISGNVRNQSNIHLYTLMYIVLSVCVFL